MTVPDAFAVILPVRLTVAIFVLDELHVTALLVALPGVTVAFKVRVCPCVSVALVLFSVIFVTLTVGLTGVAGFVTVILQVAFCPLSSVAIQIIVALPAATPVTTPVLLTFATFSFEVLYFTVFFVALFGLTVAVNVTVLPFSMLALVLFNVIFVTLTVGLTGVAGFVTVILQVAFCPLSSVAIQIIVALPAATPVTTPVLLTFATFSFEVLYFTVFFVALSGLTVAVNVTVFPFSMLALVLFNVIFVTLTVGLTGSVGNTSFLARYRLLI